MFTDMWVFICKGWNKVLFTHKLPFFNTTGPAEGHSYCRPGKYSVKLAAEPR